MKMRFKGNTEPCLQYDLIDDKSVFEFDEKRNEYCPHIQISVIGLVPRDLLTEATHPDNIDAIDVAIYLKQ